MRVVKNGTKAFLRSLGRKPGAVVLHFDLQPLQAVATGFHVHANADLRIGRVRLEGVKHHFGQRMLERRAVAGNDDGFAGRSYLSWRRFGRLVLAGFLVGFLEQRGEREGLLGNQRVAG